MSKADLHQTVMLSGSPVRKEYVSASVLTVGMVCQLDSSYQLIVSSGATDDSKGGELVVMEAPERGKGVFSSGSTPNTYAIGEQVATLAPAGGDEVLVLLASGQTITRGGLLEVASTGKCIAYASSNLAAFRALESLSPSADALIWAQRL